MSESRASGEGPASPGELAAPTDRLWLSEARYRAIVEDQPDLVCRFFPDGTLTFANDAYCRYFDVRREDVIGRPYQPVVHPDDVARVQAQVASLSSANPVVFIENRVFRGDGVVRWTEWSNRALYDAEGRLVEFQAAGRDTTERKLAEERTLRLVAMIEERESRFRLMADRAPVLIWVADTDNRGVYFNKPWIEFTGVPHESQVGDGWLSLIHPEDRVSAGAYCQEHFDRRLPFTMEFRLRHRAGGYRWVQDSGQPLFLNDGSFNGYIGSCVDIQERKAAEDRVRHVLEGISDAFNAVDRDWRFTYVNDHYTRVAGKTRDELLGRLCWDVFPDAVGTPIFEVAHRAMRDQQPTRVEDYYPPRDLWYETRLYPTPDGLISFVTDISERKRLEAAREESMRRESEARALAEEASRLKDEFLAIVSHELRTPLHAILGWAHMLRTDAVEPADLPNALETIERNARMQAQLVEDLLDVSRIVSGKLAIRSEPVDVASAVQAAFEAVRPAAANKAIELQAVLADGEVTVSGDHGRLQQAVWNLLVNAIKFTPKGGRVDVTLARTGEDAVVRVSDTGVGIPADTLPFIFDRFRQADSRTTRAQGGLGLGLTIVEYVAHAHGGTVRAESPGAGQGTTFELVLPTRASAASPAPVSSRAIRPDLTDRRVLVVDDDADAREMVRAVLEHCGASVTTAESVSEAVGLARASRPDVLVGDIGMPEQDGFDLIRLLRSVDELRRLPAVALTAYASAQHREAVLRAGYDAHLGKPVDPDALCAVVADLSRKRAADDG